MKKILFGMTLMLLLALNVNAAEVATVGELTTCLFATPSNTCVLTSDIALPIQQEIRGNITLDLNGHTITYGGDTTMSSGLLAVYHGGKLTINDSGSTGKIVSGEKVYAAIIMIPAGDTDNTKVAELVVNGGTLEGDYYAITGHGGTGRDNTKITINGGTIKGVHEDDNLGIYHPQYGTIEVNGGTITGSTGIELRAGTLTVNGGTIKGEYIPLDIITNGNGSTTKGAGIAVSQHTTKLETKLIVNGGTIEGYAAVVQPEGYDDAKVGLSLTSGTFNAINGGAEVVVATKEEFITGGTFNKALDEIFIDTEYTVDEKDSKYIVVPNTTVEATIEEGTVVFESEEAIDTTYTLSITEKGEEVVNEVKTTLTESYKEDATKTDVKLIALYEIEIKDESSEVVEMEDGTFTISIPLADDMKNFTNYKVIYVNESGEIVETLDAELVDGNVVFTTSHLSTYGIVGYNEVNPKTLDNIALSILIGSISLISLAGCALYISKKRMA